MTEMPKVFIYKTMGPDACHNKDRLAQLRWNNKFDKQIIKLIEDGFIRNAIHLLKWKKKQIDQELEGGK